jgi:hypothetical protein
MKSERDGINPAVEPSGTGCVECLALGGCGSVSADAPNAGTSAVAIVHQISTHRNTTPPRVIRQ